MRGCREKGWYSMEYTVRKEVETYRDLYFTDSENATDMRARVKGLPWFLDKEFVVALGIEDAHINIGRPIRNLFMKRNLCPVCKSREYSNNGVNSRGIPRRKCKKCGKSYIAESKINTGDNVLKSRKPTEIWLKFTKNMLDGESSPEDTGWVRKASEDCELNIKTAYEWKTRITDSITILRNYVNSSENPYFTGKRGDKDDEGWYDFFLERYRELSTDPLRSDETEWFINNVFYSLFITYYLKKTDEE